MGDLKFGDVLTSEELSAGRKCELAKAFEKMTSELAFEVKEAMRGSSSAAAISRTLQRFDIKVTEGSLRRCRRVCKCWRA